MTTNIFRFISRLTFAALAGWLVLAGGAMADDWLLKQARGVVEIEVGGVWQMVPRGTEVPDGTRIRTGRDGRATFVRGAEIVTLSPMTMLVIEDRDGKQFTHVVQMAGRAEYEVDVRNVAHFGVDTPYLAAVVKGTHFIITVRRGVADVNVTRGLVQVNDRHGHVYGVPKGAAIAVTKAGNVTGKGNVTQTTKGKSVTVTLSAKGLSIAAAASAKGAAASANASANANVGGTNGVGVAASVGTGGVSLGVTVGGGHGKALGLLK